MLQKIKANLRFNEESKNFITTKLKALEAEDELSDRKVNHDSANIIAGRDKRTGGKRGVNAITVKGNRNKSTEQRSNHNHRNKRHGYCYSGHIIHA